MRFLSTFWKCGEESVGQQGGHKPVAQRVAIRLLLEAEIEPSRWTVQLEVPCMASDIFYRVVQEVTSFLFRERLLDVVPQPVEHAVIFAVVVRIEAYAGMGEKEYR